MRCRYAFLLAGSLLFARPAKAQVLALAGPPPPPATYHYTAYTVYDRSSPGPPTSVANVGGTLTLRSDSTYDKRLSIGFPSGLRFFTQTGRYRLQGDSILFIFSDLRGPDVQRGTYRLEPATRRLTLTIAGYPPGNQGVYELLAPAALLPSSPVKKPAKSRPRRPRR